MIPNNVLRYLTFRARTEKEVRDYIQKKEIPNLEEIITRLKELNYINDLEFAKNYARTRLKSNKLLEYELKRKGISINLDNDDSATAKKILEKKKNFKSRDQAMRFLQSRGFSWSTIAGIIAKSYDD